jgi:hypothetical protein
MSSGPDLWDDCIHALALETFEAKVTPARREASAILRFTTFGEIPANNAVGAVDAGSHNDVIGTREQLRVLYFFWRALDENKSDRVDVGEFMHCATPRLQKALKELSVEQKINLPPWAKNTEAEEAYNNSYKLVCRLCEKVSRHLFGKKSSFSLEDLMRLIWMRAHSSDVQTMKLIVNDIAVETNRTRLPAPPVLDASEYRDLCAVFQHFDTENCGRLSFNELVHLGLIYSDQVEQTRKEWDRDGNGTIDMAEFCEMMCPLGYRATQHSTIGTTEDGRRVFFDGSWQPEDSVGYR